MLTTAPITYQYCIRAYRVVDGDSIWTDLSVGFDIYLEQLCRLTGVDMPEHGTVAGKLVTKVVEKWAAANSPLFVVSTNRDKYAGRYDGIVWDSTRTHTLNSYLLDNKLGRAYAGGKKPRWLVKDLKAIEKLATALLQ